MKHSHAFVPDAELLLPALSMGIPAKRLPLIGLLAIAAWSPVAVAGYLLF